MKFFVYIIYNIECDKFYIGQTNNLKRRLFEHNNELSVFTSKYKGKWILVFKEEFKSRAEAVRRERFFKKQKNKIFLKKFIRTHSSVG